MPATDRKLPLIYLEGRWWTPEDILRQVETCPSCPTSLQLLRLLEMRSLGVGVDIHELAKTRLIMALDIEPVVAETWWLDGPTILTPEAVKRDIKTEGFLGSSLIQIEERWIKGLLEKY
jgi:hypothetical protein